MQNLLFLARNKDKYNLFFYVYMVQEVFLKQAIFLLVLCIGKADIQGLNFLSENQAHFFIPQ